MPTKSQLVAADVSALLRARNALIWIVTREEARAERYIAEACAAAGYVPRFWDVAQGVTDLAGKAQTFGSKDPSETLETVRARATSPSPTDRGVWIMRDLAPWTDGIVGATVNRQVRNLARLLPTVPRDHAQAVIVMSPSGDIPQALAGHAVAINWPMPDREEIAAILDAAIAALPDDIRESAAPNGTRDAAIDGAIGLSGEEAQSCYARSLVKSRRIDPATVSAEKRRIIAREGLLEWFDPLPGGLASVGGLDVLKGWLAARAKAWTPQARAYGLPAPKGVLLAGIPGTGKSLTAKAIATAWQVPLLRVDLGSLKSKYVGSSEANLRKAFEVIESVGRCVVWFDEIEKALAGATQGAADGGVSSDALGAILSWMQERRGEAFVIATANDVESLPPELMRKGRFDEVFWIDLPNAKERPAILRAALAQHGRGDLDFDALVCAEWTATFTGSEIAALVPEAMFQAFAEGREVTERDIWIASQTVVPLAKMSAEKIERLRNWASGRARPASTPEETTTTEATRRLDF